VALTAGPIALDLERMMPTIDHRGCHVLVTEQCLAPSHISAGLEQVRRTRAGVV